VSSKKDLEEKAASHFQDKPRNFPEGRPYNCCESMLLTLTERLSIESELIPKIATGVGAGFSLNGPTVEPYRIRPWLLASSMDEKATVKTHRQRGLRLIVLSRLSG